MKFPTGQQITVDYVLLLVLIVLFFFFLRVLFGSFMIVAEILCEIRVVCVKVGVDVKGLENYLVR